jgi:hypothetical protein
VGSKSLFAPDLTRTHIGLTAFRMIFSMKRLQTINTSYIRLAYDHEETRVQLSTTTKMQLYENAGKRCERCGRQLQEEQGEFHHIRKPTLRSQPKTIQFPGHKCHTKHGHKRKVILLKPTLPWQRPKRVVHIERIRVPMLGSSSYPKTANSRKGS